MEDIIVSKDVVRERHYGALLFLIKLIRFLSTSMRFSLSMFASPPSVQGLELGISLTRDVGFMFCLCTSSMKIYFIKYNLARIKHFLFDFLVSVI
jgi:hypothetical protein